MTTYICVMLRNNAKESWGMAIGYPIGEHYTAIEAWREANEYIDSNRKVWPKMQFKIDMKEW